MMLNVFSEVLMQQTNKKELRYYFGKKFYRNNALGYWMATHNGSIYAHRWVWFNYFGEIPPGMHIHHIDENTSNNEISNLQMLSRLNHLKYHRRKKQIDPRQLMLPI